jgi:hypothetical protein
VLLAEASAGSEEGGDDPSPGDTAVASVAGFVVSAEVSGIGPGIINVATTDVVFGVVGCEAFCLGTRGTTVPFCVVDDLATIWLGVFSANESFCDC